MLRKAGLWSTSAIATLLVSGAVAPVAFAQDAQGQDAVTNVQDVVVQARRRSERLIDVPVAITAVSAETLDTYSVSRVSDMATLVPSLVAGKAASGSSASIFLRGVGSTALSAGFDQSVSFVIDGLPMSRGREISLPQFDIQNVEVLKGPQALYYGKNTTGGLIAVSSNNPTDHFESGAKAGYGFEAEEWYGEAYVSGPIAENLRGRLAGRISSSEGAFENTAAPVYLNPTGENRYSTGDRRGGADTLGLRLSLDWDPASNVSFRLKAGMTEVEDGGPTDLVERICAPGQTTPMPANGVPPSPNADCRVDGRSDSSTIPVEIANQNYRWARDGKPYADFGSEYVVLNSTFEADRFDVNAITGYYHFEQTDLNNVSGEAYPASFTQLADFTQLSQEIRLETKLDGPFNFTVGGFISRGEFDFHTDAYIVPVPLMGSQNYLAFSRDNGFTQESQSLFLQGTWAISEQWELSGGARQSWESRSSYQQGREPHIAFAAAYPGTIRLTDNYEDDNLSPEVTLRYKPSRDTTAYVAYKQGFKGGGFNISQALSPLASVELGRFGAETAEGFEAGWRTLLFDRALAFNITAYSYEYSDLQVQYFDPVTVSLTAGNAGELQTRGIEADFQWMVPSVEGLTVRGAAAYNDAQYKDYIGQCYGGQTVAQGCNLMFDEATGAYNGQDYDGLTPPKAPEFAGRLGATYERAISSSGIRLRLNGDVAYTSEYNYTDALRPDAVQDAYTKLDLSVSLSAPDDRWTVALIGRNLTDELVVTAANEIPFAGGTGAGTPEGVWADMSAFIDNPPEIFIELSWRF